MPSSDQGSTPPVEPRDQRLRADPIKVGLARLRLAATDRAVFSAASKHAIETHDRLLRQLVTGLFGNG